MGGMNYEIFTDGEGSYLRVVIEGEIDVKDLDTLDEKLRHAARQHGIPALLIDVRKARNVSQKPKIVEYGREPAVASAGFPREWPRGGSCGSDGTAVTILSSTLSDFGDTG